MKHKQTKHPGFETVAREIAKKQGIPLEQARAILAAKARKATKAAVANNPRLLNVKRGKNR